LFSNVSVGFAKGKSSAQVHAAINIRCGLGDVRVAHHEVNEVLWPAQRTIDADLVDRESGVDDGSVRNSQLELHQSGLALRPLNNGKRGTSRLCS
jgi:hypothetical protein